MAPSNFKKTVKNDTLSPYALSGGDPWLKVGYRFDDAEPWQNALSQTTTSVFVLQGNREDVRTDALHSFEIEIDPAPLQAEGFALEDVELVLLTRDNFTKEVVTFIKQPLSKALTVTLTVPRAALETTSLAARIDFHLMLVTAAAVEGGGRKYRRGGRLSGRTISVSAERKGHSFHFAKTTAKEFLALNLPPYTTYYLRVDEPTVLIEACDDVSSMLSVLVHEDAWSTLQEIQAGDRTGEAVGAMFLADVVGAVLAGAREAARSEQRDVEDGSITMRMLGWLSDKSGRTAEELKQQLLSERDDFMRLLALTQDTIRVTGALHRVRLGEEDQG